MDSSTIIFVATLAIAFVFLRWLISPIPATNEFNVDLSPTNEASPATGSGTTASTAGSTANRARQRSRRPVTESMIEVVKTIAPQLTRDQIVMDLSNTGSVELTIERYMELGDLPHPNGAREEEPAAAADSAAPDVAAAASTPAAKKETPRRSINLLEKYDLDVDAASSGSDAAPTFQHRKQDMILGARKRLEAQLKNELDLQKELNL